MIVPSKCVRKRDKERERWTESMLHTSDKSPRIEISVGIALPVERTCVEKKAEQQRARATFHGDRRGEAGHYSDTVRERGGPVPPMSWVDWTEWRRGGGNSVSRQTAAKSVNPPHRTQLTATVSHTVEMNTEACSSRFSPGAGRERRPSHCNRFSFLCRPRYTGDNLEIRWHAFKMCKNILTEVSGMQRRKIINDGSRHFLSRGRETHAAPVA